jgi:hypothetical protein
VARHRWTKPRGVIGVVGVAAAVAAAPLRAQVELSGLASVETRGFFQSPLQPMQERHGLSVALRPELHVEWGDGYQSLTFEPFARYDVGDRERTHVDVRTLAWERAWRSWELRVGIRRVFWGVTESQHLVDIVNQTDLVEGPDGEDKLGQPMVNLALVRGWGTLDLFVLPGFRQRTYPGLEGRLRGSLPVSGDAEYASRAGDRHIDLAARWSRSLGSFDVAVSGFRGTSRDPTFRVAPSAEGAAVIPRYEQIDQVAIEGQYTMGAWLWKLEALSRGGLDEGRYFAMVAGFERTTYQLLGTDADLGLLLEYHVDDRRSRAPTPFQDDIFVGTRIALNDVAGTALLAGVVVDRRSGGGLYLLEAGRRMAVGWTLDLELRDVWGAQPEDPLFGLRRDGHVSLSVSRWF